MYQLEEDSGNPPVFGPFRSTCLKDVDPLSLNLPLFVFIRLFFSLFQAFDEAKAYVDRQAKKKEQERKLEEKRAAAAAKKKRLEEEKQRVAAERLRAGSDTSETGPSTGAPSADTSGGTGDDGKPGAKARDGLPPCGGKGSGRKGSKEDPPDGEPPPWAMKGRLKPQGGGRKRSSGDMKATADQAATTSSSAEEVSDRSGAETVTETVGGTPSAAVSSAPDEEGTADKDAKARGPGTDAAAAPVAEVDTPGATPADGAAQKIPADAAETEVSAGDDAGETGAARSNVSGEAKTGGGDDAEDSRSMAGGEAQAAKADASAAGPTPTADDGTKTKSAEGAEAVEGPSNGPATVEVGKGEGGTDKGCIEGMPSSNANDRVGEAGEATVETALNMSAAEDAQTTLATSTKNDDDDGSTKAAGLTSPIGGVDLDQESVAAALDAVIDDVVDESTDSQATADDDVVGQAEEAGENESGDESVGDADGGNEDEQEEGTTTAAAKATADACATDDLPVEEGADDGDRHDSIPATDVCLTDKEDKGDASFATSAQTSPGEDSPEPPGDGVSSASAIDEAAPKSEFEPEKVQCDSSEPTISTLDLDRDASSCSSSNGGRKLGAAVGGDVSANTASRSSGDVDDNEGKGKEEVDPEKDSDDDDDDDLDSDDDDDDDDDHSSDEDDMLFVGRTVLTRTGASSDLRVDELLGELAASRKMMRKASKDETQPSVPTTAAVSSDADEEGPISVSDGSLPISSPPVEVGEAETAEEPTRGGSEADSDDAEEAQVSDSAAAIVAGDSKPPPPPPPKGWTRDAGGRLVRISSEDIVDDVESVNGTTERDEGDEKDGEATNSGIVSGGNPETPPTPQAPSGEETVSTEAEEPLEDIDAFREVPSEDALRTPAKHSPSVEETAAVADADVAEADVAEIETTMDTTAGREPASLDSTLSSEKENEVSPLPTSRDPSFITPEGDAQTRISVGLDGQTVSSEVEQPALPGPTERRSARRLGESMLGESREALDESESESPGVVPALPPNIDDEAGATTPPQGEEAAAVEGSHPEEAGDGDGDGASIRKQEKVHVETGPAKGARSKQNKNSAAGSAAATSASGKPRRMSAAAARKKQRHQERLEAKHRELLEAAAEGAGEDKDEQEDTHEEERTLGVGEDAGGGSGEGGTSGSGTTCNGDGGGGDGGGGAEVGHSDAAAEKEEEEEKEKDDGKPGEGDWEEGRRRTDSSFVEGGGSDAEGAEDKGENSIAKVKAKATAAGVDEEDREGVTSAAPLSERNPLLYSSGDAVTSQPTGDVPPW